VTELKTTNKRLSHSTRKQCWVTGANSWEEVQWKERVALLKWVGPREWGLWDPFIPQRMRQCHVLAGTTWDSKKKLKGSCGTCISRQYDGHLWSPVSSNNCQWLNWNNCFVHFSGCVVAVITSHVFFPFHIFKLLQTGIKGLSLFLHHFLCCFLN